MEDYIDIDLAGVLMALGFDEKCETFWEDESEPDDHENLWVIKYRRDYPYATLDKDRTILRPTLYQVQKWIYEKKNIYIQISANNELRNFSYDLKFDYDSPKNYCTQGFTSPTEALSAGIHEAIKLLYIKRL